MLREVVYEGKTGPDNTEFVRRYKEIRQKLMPEPKRVMILKAKPRVIAVSEIMPEPPPPIVLLPETSAKNIIRNFTIKYGKTKEQIFSRSRKREVVLIKQEVWAALRDYGLSYPVIATMSRPHDPFDHTTVMHGVKKFKKRNVQQTKEGQPDHATE